MAAAVVAYLTLLSVGAASAQLNAAPSAAAAPSPQPAAPAPAPGATQPHFGVGTYGVLSSSGDRVSTAVQRVLGVQGSLDELKQDLSTEYSRAKARQKDLAAQRLRLQYDIQGDRAKLLAQKSQRAHAGRLRGDLALAKHAYATVDKTQGEARNGWLRKQESLRKEILNLAIDINTTRTDMQKNIATAHNNTDVLRKRHSVLSKEILKSNKSLAEYEESRAKHSVVCSREQAAILKQVGILQQQKAIVTDKLHNQHRLQWEHKRLAEQAREVVKKREEIEQDRIDCDAKIRTFHDKLEETAEKLKEDSAALRDCQAMQAENAQLQAKANACWAASRAGG